PLEGAAVGKTGTLTAEVDGGMASLGGVVYTEKAGMFVFAILDRGNRIAENREMEDQLLVEAITTQYAPAPVPAETPRRLLPQSNLRIEPELADHDAPARVEKADEREERAESKEKKETGGEKKAARRDERAEGNKTKSRNSVQKTAATKRRGTTNQRPKTARKRG
ncbi:MAG: hypothetical protein ACRD68_09805, partial [Pyrinomonadaceae bacterium]